jgi:hypothetical protein
MAEAEAEALDRISQSLPEGQAAMYLLGIKYLEALPKITEGKGTTIFLPAEATGVMGALGGLRELLVKSAKDAGATSTVDPTRRPSGTARTSSAPPASAPSTPRLGAGEPRDARDDSDGDVVAEL